MHNSDRPSRLSSESFVYLDKGRRCPEPAQLRGAPTMCSKTRTGKSESTVERHTNYGATMVASYVEGQSNSETPSFVVAAT